MNINYSQFYRGTTDITSYGNGAYKKDTLVKYEFNTTDENGNKVMDKMSREETLQAMKDISSQYEDGVIVEFSGDGMAALVESRKGVVDDSITQEQRDAIENRNKEFHKELHLLQQKVKHEKFHSLNVYRFDDQHFHHFHFQQLLICDLHDKLGHFHLRLH